MRPLHKAYRTRILFFLAAALALIAAAPGSSLAEYVGMVSRVEGRVDILRPGAPGTEPLARGDAVAEGDIVRTKSDGRAEIVFRDKTVVDIAPETRIRIDRYSFTDGGEREDGVISLFRGKIRSIVSKVKSRIMPAAAGTSSYKVKTPTTVMGVKGTDVFVFYKKGATGVVFREGHGFVYNVNMPDSAVDLGAGEMTLVRGSDSPPVGPKSVTEVELEYHLRDTTPSLGHHDDDGEAAAEGDDNDGVYGYSSDDHDDDHHDGHDDHDGDHDDVAGLSDFDDHDDYDDHHHDDGHDDDGDDYAFDSGDSDDADIPYSEVEEGTVDGLEVHFGSADASTSLDGALAVTSATSGEIDYEGSVSGEWELDTRGSYERVTVSDPMDVSTSYDDGRIITGAEGADVSWANESVSGDVVGYGADSARGKTWVSAGRIRGAFDPAQHTWRMGQEGVFVETPTFLAMTSTSEGRAALGSVGIPFAEVGSTDLTGSNGNMMVDMNGVKFFSYSTGGSPRIWATDGVAGTYSTLPTQGETVSLTGDGLSADFSARDWRNGTWGAAVNGGGTFSGAGSMNGTTVEMEGAAAGTYDSGTFSGTGSGVTR